MKYQVLFCLPKNKYTEQKKKLYTYFVASYLLHYLFNENEFYIKLIRIQFFKDMCKRKSDQMCCV